MKANELMINDWVFYIGDGEPKQTQVMEITSLRQVQLFDGEDLSSWFLVGEKYIEPIPLTAEILEKNGFDKRNDGCVWNDENGSTVVVLWKEYNYTHCYNYIDASIGCITVRELPITYVHELQHFFRLCGINKKISL